MRNLSQVYSWPKLLDMTPFPISRFGHNNQALSKRFAYQGTKKQYLGLPNPNPKLHLKYANGVMTSCIGRTTNQPFGMHLRHVHVPASSPCLPPLLGLNFLNPKVGVRFWFGPTQESSICPMPFNNSICLIQISHDTISWKFLSLYFTCNLMWYIFMWQSAPLKERWCPHHALCLFFADLVWNSSMASWACSMSDLFTQDASIGWYPFHLTRYSRSRPLSYLDLSTASTSNSGSLWTKSGGGLEWCSRLGLEASQETGFKRETWNVGWTLRFSGNSNL